MIKSKAQKKHELILKIINQTQLNLKENNLPKQVIINYIY